MMNALLPLGHLGNIYQVGNIGAAFTSIRRPVRALARKGLLRFEHMLWSEDGYMIGAGYGLTDLGADVIRRFRDLVLEADLS